MQRVMLVRLNHRNCGQLAGMRKTKQELCILQNKKKNIIKKLKQKNVDKCADGRKERKVTHNIGVNKIQDNN